MHGRGNDKPHPWQDLGMDAGGLDRVLLPLSSLTGWGLVTIGALMVLHVFGLNIQPLLTIGGVGGVAIGFGAQSVTSNAISGINLVSTSSHPHVAPSNCSIFLT